MVTLQHKRLIALESLYAVNLIAVPEATAVGQDCPCPLEGIADRSTAVPTTDK